MIDITVSHYGGDEMMKRGSEKRNVAKFRDVTQIMRTDETKKSEDVQTEHYQATVAGPENYCPRHHASVTWTRNSIETRT